MDGIHDLGGMSGFGPVEVERDEPIFHERWEARAFALVFAPVSLAEVVRAGPAAARLAAWTSPERR
jgi:hypothetical protein